MFGVGAKKSFDWLTLDCSLNSVSSLAQIVVFAGVESYTIGSELQIFYWKGLKRQLGRPNSTAVEKLLSEKETGANTYTILVSLEESSSTFFVSHFPPLTAATQNSDLFAVDPRQLKVANVSIAINSVFIPVKQTNLFQLIAKTIAFRCREALESLLTFLNRTSPGFPASYNCDDTSVSIQVLHPMHQSEAIKVSVQSKTGMFVVSCAKLSQQTCVDLEVAINRESLLYKQKLESIRKSFLLERVNNSIYGLSCSVVESPSLSYTSVTLLNLLNYHF